MILLFVLMIFLFFFLPSGCVMILGEKKLDVEYFLFLLY